MGLYERWTAQSDAKIRVHPFVASLRELARGNVTRQQVIDAFTLTGADITELDAIAAAYVALPNQAAKDRYIGLINDVIILAEEGHYTRSVCASRLGFT